MNDSSCQNIGTLLTALVEGRFDDLSPDEMAVVEQHLNECAECSSRLAGVDGTCETAIMADVQEPSAEQWDQTGAAIDDSLSSVTGQRSSTFRFGRMAMAGLSVAALLAIGVTVGQFAMRSGLAGRGMQLASASEVEIESVEVFGDTDLLVLNTGDEGDPSIIWVVEDSGT